MGWLDHKKKSIIPMLLYIFSITSIKILLSFWELYKLTVNYVGKKKRKIQKELQKLGAGRGGKGECSPRSPSRKVRTWSSLATEVLSKAKKSQSFASFSPPTAPPNLGFFPSYCKCADCPPSAFRSHSLHFSTAPGTLVELRRQDVSYHLTFSYSMSHSSLRILQRRVYQKLYVYLF